jgi:hypothetical protein
MLHDIARMGIKPIMQYLHCLLCHCAAGVVIVQMKTVNRRPLIVKVDVHKDLGGDSSCQNIYSKLL